MKALIQVAAAAAIAGIASQACAQNNSIRGGLEYVAYRSSATDVSGPFVPPGVNLKAKNLTTAYLAYIRTLTPSWDFELAGGWPPKSEVEGKGPATLGSVPYDGQVISSAKWFSPTAFIEYKFLDPSSVWRPFVGVGVNYTHFYDRKSTAAGDAATGGPTAISLPDSVGLAVTAGVNYRLQEHWSLHASYSRAHVATNAELNTAGTIRRTSINFKPGVVVLSVGYDF